MERDRRGLRLSAGGAILTLLAFVAACAATASPYWAYFTVTMGKHFGLWRECTTPGLYGPTICKTHLATTWAIVPAQIGSAACTGLLGVAAFMCPLLLIMHVTSKKTLIKFRHATFAKMVCIALSVLCGFVCIIFFVMEVFIFKPSKYGDSFSLSWAFILQVVAMVLSVVAGVGAGIEFGWSRKLGGDPTVYNRDPEGTSATTITNPNFRDSRNGHVQSGNGNSRGRSGSQRGRLQRNPNGVAMTHLSGQPYMITANGSNGHAGGRSNGKLAFDPNRTPLRSSLRKPKPAPPEDAPDSSLGIHNLAFTQSSPPAKKKVRIHTQSTSV